MSKIDTGGTAFPCDPTEAKGMSLRDYLAAKAMAGELASDSLRWGGDVFSLVAMNAYKFADAMLEARK